MDVVFLKLVNMSIAAGWLILAVVVLRLLLKKAPKWLPCALWTIVAIRLICPFALESSFSLIPSAETIPVQNIFSSNSAIADNTYYHQLESGIPQLDRAFMPLMTEMKSGSVLRSNISVLTAFWMAGMLLIFLHALINFWRIHVMVREAIPLRDNIWLCDTVKSPFILGIIRPRIYLSSGMEEGQMDYVLAHEQAHLKRRDHWWKPLGYLLLSVYWFNPLVWVAYILLCRDIELACDEKVIKDIDIKGKKIYSETLVACSMQRRMVLSCPLAFGEVGVKERVRTVLNYKKPAFWLILVAAVVCAVVAVCFLSNPNRDSFNIRIVIPAGGEGPVYYSDEEISPNRSKITLSSGEGLGDTAVSLKIVYDTWENDYGEPVYLTPGMPVRMDVEKGAWFRVGVAMSNPTNEDIVVYVRVKDVEVRISDSTVGESEENANDDLYESAVNVEEESQPPTGGSISTGGMEDSLDNRVYADAESAISAAIMERCAPSYQVSYDFECCDFLILKEESATPVAEDTTHTITYYGWALYQICDISEQGISNVRGSHIPLALTFELSADGYQLKEYWEPESGSYFNSSIHDRFPEDIAEDGTDSQKFVLQQVQSCYKQAILFSGLDTDAVISSLLDTICSEPGTSSNPQDYIDAHYIEYRELLFYGEYTLSYCFERFGHGNETGLDGKIMAIVCEELLQTKGNLPVDAGTADTGQLWYDTLLAHAGNKVEPFLN